MHGYITIWIGDVGLGGWEWYGLSGGGADDVVGEVDGGV